MSQDEFQAAMRWAAGLVRAGRAQEATAAIQAALREVPDQPRRARAEVIRSALPEPATRAGQWVERRFAGVTGTREYALYVPSAPARPLPLVVMLHGCTQTPRDFAAGTQMNALAEGQGCLVLYPSQPQSANGSRCWNWFETAHQRSDAGEPALLAALTRQVLADYGADPARVFVAGLSAGGAMALVMAATHPQLFRSAGVHSGLAYRAARDLPGALAAMRQGGAGGGAAPVPTIVFHGDQDATVNPRNGVRVGEQAAARLGVREPAVSQGRAPGGHAYTRTVYRDAAGRGVLERWLVHGLGHAWSGGSPAGSFTDARGPDASREMLRFFMEQV